MISMNAKLEKTNVMSMPIAVTAMARIPAPAKMVTLEMVSVAQTTMSALLKTRMVVT